MAVAPTPSPGAGRIAAVDGPVVVAVGLADAAVGDLVEVGARLLPGEIVSLAGGRATIQVYEYTGGLRPGDPVAGSGEPLSAELGPGLLGGIFDGMLRPLTDGASAVVVGGGRRTLDPERRFDWRPAVEAGAPLEPGSVLGSVQETPLIEHRILVPEGVAGSATTVLPAGPAGVDAVVATIAGRPLTMTTRWPVRRPRPAVERLPAIVPLTTGQRAIDLLYPLARGSTACVPGGFGTGKTVVLQQLAKWCDADVIVYVACGERGNELADILRELGRLDDPRGGGRLLDRTVLIANASNMPVMAREAGVHVGVTVAEYYRDMGHDAVVIADSTSRWAEALREVAARTGLLPAEEGYPANLASQIAAFYERAGRVRTRSGATGSVSIIGAVSPPGDDLTEPVTAHSRRFTRCVWALDRELAYARHYPAIGWLESSSRDAPALERAQGTDPEHRRRALALLSDAARLEAMAELVGGGALPAEERMLMLGAQLLRDAVLEQSALSANDGFCSPAKGAALLESVLALLDRALELVAAGVRPDAIEALDRSRLIQAREQTPPDDAAGVRAIGAAALADLEALR